MHCMRWLCLCLHGLHACRLCGCLLWHMEPVLFSAHELARSCPTITGVQAGSLHELMDRRWGVGSYDGLLLPAPAAGP